MRAIAAGHVGPALVALDRGGTCGGTTGVTAGQLCGPAGKSGANQSTVVAARVTPLRAVSPPAPGGRLLWTDLQAGRYAWKASTPPAAPVRA